MRVVVDSDESGGEVLEVSGMVDPDMEGSEADTSDPASALMDALTTSVPEDDKGRHLRGCRHGLGAVSLKRKARPRGARTAGVALRPRIQRTKGRATRYIVMP